MTFIYWITRGFTEGWKWSDKIPSASVYHLVRLVECIAVYLLGVKAYGWEWTTASTLIGIFVYERINQKLASGNWFKKKGQIFDIGIKIKRYKWQDYLILTAGIGVLLYEFIR